jgi:hypothetical protein
MIPTSGETTRMRPFLPINDLFVTQGSDVGTDVAMDGSAAT